MSRHAELPLPPGRAAGHYPAGQCLSQARTESTVRLMPVRYSTDTDHFLGSNLYLSEDSLTLGHGCRQCPERSSVISHALRRGDRSQGVPHDHSLRAVNQSVTHRARVPSDTDGGKQRQVVRVVSHQSPSCRGCVGRPGSGLGRKRAMGHPGKKR